MPKVYTAPKEWFNSPKVPSYTSQSVHEFTSAPFKPFTCTHLIFTSVSRDSNASNFKCLHLHTADYKWSTIDTKLHGIVCTCHDLNPLRIATCCLECTHCILARSNDRTNFLKGQSCICTCAPIWLYYSNVYARAWTSAYTVLFISLPLQLKKLRMTTSLDLSQFKFQGLVAWNAIWKFNDWTAKVLEIFINALNLSSHPRLLNELGAIP